MFPVVLRLLPFLAMQVEPHPLLFLFFMVDVTATEIAGAGNEVLGAKALYS